MRPALVFLLLTTLAASACSADDVVAPEKTVAKPVEKIPAKEMVAATFSANDAWTTPALTKNGAMAVYMTLENNGSSPIAIKGVSSEVAGKAELHQHEMDSNGTMSMPKMDSLTIPPHERVELKPGGMHVMLFDSKKALGQNETIPVTFTYNDGAVMTTSVAMLNEREAAARKRELADSASSSGAMDAMADMPEQPVKTKHAKRHH